MKKKIISLSVLLMSCVIANAQDVLSLINKRNVLPDRIYSFIVNNRSDSVIANATQEVSAVLTAEMLSQSMSQLRMQYGEIVNADKWNFQTYEGMSVFTREVSFEKCYMPLILTFDKENKLAGLRFGFPKMKETVAKMENEREITIETDGLKMPGLLTLPHDSKGRKSPCVILVHGSGPSDMNEAIGQNKPFLDLAKGLSKRGIAVLRYDKRTFVHKDKSVPEGRNLDYDVETVDDALTAVDLARQSAEINGDSIFVLGHSLGAILAPRIAERSGKVAGIIMLAGTPLSLIDIIREQNVTIGGITDSQKLDSIMDNVRKTLPESYLDFDSKYSAGETARKLKIPMLVLQGERDIQVSMSDYNAWKEYLSQANAIMKSYKKLNHIFMEGEGKPDLNEYLVPSHIPDYVIDDIVSFIKKGISD